MLFLWIGLATLAVFAIGYVIGRWWGYDDGFDDGQYNVLDALPDLIAQHRRDHPDE